MDFRKWRFWHSGKVLTSNGRMGIAMLAFLILVMLGSAFVSCATDGKGPTPSYTVCTTSVAEYLATFCPVVAGGSWKTTETCRHSILGAYHLKMAACIGDGVLKEDSNAEDSSQEENDEEASVS